MPEPFVVYLTEAVRAALRRARRADDEGALWRMNKLCRRGVKENWDALTERTFLKGFLWVVGAIQKPIEQHQEYYPRQLRLFRGCSPQAILRDRALILDQWQTKRRNLNRLMVDAVLSVGCRVASEGWERFKEVTLPLPRNPEAEDRGDWRATYAALDSLPMIGDANVWFILRNLLGAPFLKPDLHIKVIANAFFGAKSDPLAALSVAVRASWPRVCRDRRLQPVHMGEVDYILWDYRRRTWRPAAS